MGFFVLGLILGSSIVLAIKIYILIPEMIENARDFFSELRAKIFGFSDARIRRFLFLAKVRSIYFLPATFVGIGFVALPFGFEKGFYIFESDKVIPVIREYETYFGAGSAFLVAAFGYATNLYHRHLEKLQTYHLERARQAANLFLALPFLKTYMERSNSFRNIFNQWRDIISPEPLSEAEKDMVLDVLIKWPDHYVLVGEFFRQSLGALAPRPRKYSNSLARVFNGGTRRAAVELGKELFQKQKTSAELSEILTTLNS